MQGGQGVGLELDFASERVNTADSNYSRDYFSISGKSAKVIAFTAPWQCVIMKATGRHAYIAGQGTSPRTIAHSRDDTKWTWQ